MCKTSSYLLVTTLGLLAWGSLHFWPVSIDWHPAPEVLQRQVAAFRHLRHTCKWRNRDNAIIMKGIFLNETVHVAVQFCEVDNWRIWRVGEMLSQGGMNTINLNYYPDAFEFRPQPSAKLFLTGSYTSIIRSDSEEILSSDDFHYHHLFVYHGDLSVFSSDGPLQDHDSIANLRWLQEHGDDTLNPSVLVFTGSDHSCKANQGGEDCLMFEYPSGFAQEILHRDTTTWDVVDMRPASSMAASFFVEAAVRTTTVSPSGRLVFSSFINGWWLAPRKEWDVTFGSKPQHWGEYKDPWPLEGGGVVLRSNLMHVYWSATRSPCSGDLVYTHIHSHRIAEQKHWLFAGAPSSLGLNRPPFIMSKPWLPVVLNDTNVTRFEEYMLMHMRATDSSVICTSTPVRDPALHRSYIESIDREDNTVCRSWHFIRGEFKTQVCAAQIPTGYPRQDHFMSMHCTTNQLWVVDDHCTLEFTQWGARDPGKRVLPEHLRIKDTFRMQSLGGFI